MWDKKVHDTCNSLHSQSNDNDLRFNSVGSLNYQSTYYRAVCSKDNSKPTGGSCTFEKNMCGFKNGGKTITPALNNLAKEGIGTESAA